MSQEDAAFHARGGRATAQRSTLHSNGEISLK